MNLSKGMPLIAVAVIANFGQLQAAFGSELSLMSKDNKPITLYVEQSQLLEPGASRATQLLGTVNDTLYCSLSLFGQVDDPTKNFCEVRVIGANWELSGQRNSGAGELDCRAICVKYKSN